MPFKISRISVKNPNTEFVDSGSLTGEEEQIRENFFAFARDLPGRMANTVIVTTIDENTVKRTWDMDSPLGKEELFAGIYMREMGTSTDPARTAYLNMMKAKGESMDLSKCYWEVEYANGHIQIYKFGPNS
jgi:hypothetical protein